MACRSRRSWRAPCRRIRRAALQGTHGHAGRGRRRLRGADLRQALTGAGATLAAQDASPALDILVLDATGCTSIASCRSVYELMHARVGLLAKNARADRGGGALGRRQPGSGRQAMEGFTRSLAKEIGKRGATANLVQVARDACDRLDWIVRFLCGHHSAYISGQVLRASAVAALLSRTTVGAPAGRQGRAGDGQRARDRPRHGAAPGPGRRDRHLRRPGIGQRRPGRPVRPDRRRRPAA
ncbi:hypothetical protein LP419_39470 [Massilia sp. H-1]|nr:hypothetical protein LP419_39470 [Massilia sp. H-1]